MIQLRKWELAEVLSFLLPPAFATTKDTHNHTIHVLLSISDVLAVIPNVQVFIFTYPVYSI